MAEKTVRVRFEAMVGPYRTAVGQMATDTRRFGEQTMQTAQRNQAAFTQAGFVIAAAGAGITATLGAAAGAAIDFESSFAGVRKTVDASEAEFDRLESSFRGLATEIPITVGEINSIGEAAGQLGIQTDNIVDFTRVMADLGVATNMTATEAATSLARFGNIAGTEEGNFDRLGATIVDLGNNLATTESEITDMALRLAGAGTQIGLTEADILGLSGALSSVGIRAEAGGTALSKVMIEMASEVERGGDRLEMFAEVAGVTAEEFATRFRDDAAGALVAFVSGLGDMESRGQSTLGVLENLEITETRMRDALLRASGAGDLLAESIERGSQAWSENTALTEEAEQRYKTAEAQIQLAKNQLADLAITVGQVVAPVISEGAGLVGDFAGAVNDLPEPVLAAGTAVAGLAGAAALLGGATLILLPRIAQTKVAMAQLGLTAGGAATKMRALAVSAAPWLVAAGAAVAVNREVVQSFDEGRRAAREMADEIRSSAGTVEEAQEQIRASLGDRADDVATPGAPEMAFGPALDLVRLLRGEATFTGEIMRDFGETMQLAWESVRPGAEVLTSVRRSADDLDPSLQAATVSMGRLEHETGQSAEAIADLDDGMGSASVSVSGFESSASSAARETERLTGALRDQSDALREQTDPFFAAQAAQERLSDAAEAYTEVTQDAGASDEDRAGAVGDLVQAERDLELAILDLAEADAEHGDILDEVDRLVRRVAEAHGIAEDDARTYLEALGVLDERAQDVIGSERERLAAMQESAAESREMVARFDELVEASGGYADALLRIPERRHTAVSLDLQVSGVGRVQRAIQQAESGQPITGLAAGGPATAGQPYWVGEHGRPELFVPDESGQILTEQQAARMGVQQAQPTRLQPSQLQPPPQVNVTVQGGEQSSVREFRFGDVHAANLDDLMRQAEDRARIGALEGRRG